MLTHKPFENMMNELKARAIEEKEARAIERLIGTPPITMDPTQIFEWAVTAGTTIARIVRKAGETLKQAVRTAVLYVAGYQDGEVYNRLGDEIESRLKAV